MHILIATWPIVLQPSSDSYVFQCHHYLATNLLANSNFKFALRCRACYPDAVYFHNAALEAM